MAVYVDPAVHPWRNGRWCHMAADTLSELHEMADKIGLKRDWFQCPPKVKYPHYDMIAWRRKLAIENGAIPVSSREILAKAKLLRAEYDKTTSQGSPDQTVQREG